VAGLAVRLGVFGGTFDPPHLGHLILAAEAVDQLQLERVLWVITPDPPHKLNRPISPLAIRIALLQAALEGEERFILSRVDVDRPGPQYAVDTLRILSENNPGSQLFYLIGGDSLHDLPTWYAPERLLECVEGLGVMRRPGDRLDMAKLEQRLPGITAKVHFIDTPQLDIASHDIRRRIAQGKPYRYFLPVKVCEMIEGEGWYK
jgi:nicotinate-nucleotide adenylyltransferase